MFVLRFFVFIKCLYLKRNAKYSSTPTTRPKYSSTPTTRPKYLLILCILLQVCTYPRTNPRM